MPPERLFSRLGHVNEAVEHLGERLIPFVIVHGLQVFGTVAQAAGVVSCLDQGVSKLGIRGR